LLRLVALSTLHDNETNGEITEELKYRSPNKMHMLQNLFCMTIALHVSGIIIAYLQEHKTTVTSAPGNRYAVIYRVKYFTVKEYL
jgi:hypothetical protein